MKFEITKWLHIKSFIFAIIISLLFTKSINLSLDSITMLAINHSNPVLSFIVIVLGMVLTMAFIHEIFHAIGYLMFGGKIKIGFKYIYAYVQETSGIELKSWQFLITLLLPLFALSIPAMIYPNWLTLFIFVFNLIGSFGDITMAFFLAKNNFKGKIVDTDNGFIIV